MHIHECARCEGCGYITGSLRWEIPWSRWADAKDPGHQDGILEAHPCPDCGGTGALIRMHDVARTETVLPSRRGLYRQPSYAEHVDNVLHMQHVLKY